MKPLVALLLCATVLAGCVENRKESPQAQIEAAIHAHSGPPKLTLFTMVNNRTGTGGHSGLLVQGSQSVIFDPAGSFAHETIPESGDVLYGMTPIWVERYKSAHARTEFHVVAQEFNVTAAQAERALQLVQARGAVASAHCAHSISGILRQIPGFDPIRQVYFPVSLMEQAAELPGVSTSRYYEED